MLEWVSPDAVSVEDVLWLEKADSAGPSFYHLPLERILLEMRAKAFHLFRLKPGPGVVLLDSYKSASGQKRLRIVRLGGKGVAWGYKALMRDLQHIARDWGCQQVETMVYNGRVAKAIQRAGAKAEAINLVLEV